VNSRRLAVGGLAVLASATFALAACTGSSSSTGGGASASAAAPSPTPASPKEVLQASVKQLTQTTYKYTTTSAGLNGQGAADPVGKKVSLSVGGTQSGLTVKMDFLLIGSDLYAKVDFGGQNSVLSIPTKWMHLDQAKMGKNNPLGFDPSAGDPTETSGIFAGLVDAQRVDATHYTATFDLTKASGSAVDADTRKKLGDKAKSVPGTVTLDEQGRLTSLTIDLSAVDPKLGIKDTFSDYGSPVSISPPPAADTVEAPDSVYKIFSGS
jgi:hypothetical protein